MTTWWEVVSGCDGYYTPKRFKTEKQAQRYVDFIQEYGYDVHISEGPYLVSTEDAQFYSQEGQ